MKTANPISKPQAIFGESLECVILTSRSEVGAWNMVSGSNPPMHKSSKIN